MTARYLQRFSPYAVDGGCDAYGSMEEDDFGDYYKAEDVDAEIARLREALDRSQRFEAADWYWRAMDPDDCGYSPEEAINRAMVGQFCVCEIASSFTGPTRYGFIAPTLEPESDDDEFVHFATQQEAIAAAKARAALSPSDTGSNRRNTP